MNGNKDDFDDQFGPDDEALEEGLYDEGLDGGPHDDLGEGLEEADGDYGDEDWDAYDGEESGTAAQAGGADALKKKRARFNAMVIGGGVVLGVLFLGFNLMKGGSAVPSAPQPAAQQEDVSTQIAAEEHSRSRLSSASLQANSPTAQRNVIYGRGREDAPQERGGEQDAASGFLNDPAEIARVEKYRADLEQELTGEQGVFEDDGAADAVAVPSETRRAQEPVAAVTAEEVPPMPVPAMNSADSTILTPLPDTQDSVLSVGLPRVQDLVRAQDGPQEDAQEPVAAQEQAAQERPRSPFDGEDAVPELTAAPALSGAARESAPAVPVVSESAAAELAAVTRELDDVKAELQRVKKEMAQLQDLQSTVRQLERALEARATAAPAAEAAATRPEPRRDAAPARPQAAPARWVLKSARPGQAMVARAGDNEMRSVTIGDNLPGVGRVTQIYRGAAGWVVEGTAGKITQ